MKWLSYKILQLFGWTAIHAQPPSKHGIIVVYPHTSNWDFPLGILWRFTSDIYVRWVVKHTWFRFPFGSIMRSWGGIGIRRDGNLDVTTQLRNMVLNEPECWLCIPPEGTRSGKDYIHMGYYHIAKAANIPIAIAVMDYKTKTVGIREYRMAKDTVEEELAQMAIDYQNIVAYDPSKAGALKAHSK